MTHPTKYKVINTNFFRSVYRLLVVLYLFIYLNYILRATNISLLIYTDMRYEDKHDRGDQFSISACFNFSKSEFLDKFCIPEFDSTYCEGFKVSIIEEREKYAKKSMFDEQITRREGIESNKFYFKFNDKFCIKYESKVATKNRYFYSLRVCETAQLESFVTKIYVHQRDRKLDQLKDYIYEFSWKLEAKFGVINVNFEKVESRLLESPYWTNCFKYPGNSTRSECVDRCYQNKFNITKRDYLNMVEDQYDYFKQNKTERKECVDHCRMPCSISLYAVDSVTKKLKSEMENHTTDPELKYTGMIDQDALEIGSLDKLNMTNKDCKYINLREKPYFR